MSKAYRTYLLDEGKFTILCPGRLQHGDDHRTALVNALQSGEIPSEADRLRDERPVSKGAKLAVQESTAGLYNTDIRLYEITRLGKSPRVKAIVI